MSFLDKLPVASLTFLAGLAIIIIGYVSDDLKTVEDAFKALLYLGGGSFGIGYVRNQAGRGLRGDTDN